MMQYKTKFKKDQAEIVAFISLKIDHKKIEIRWGVNPNLSMPEQVDIPEIKHSLKVNELLTSSAVSPVPYGKAKNEMNKIKKISTFVR